MINYHVFLHFVALAAWGPFPELIHCSRDTSNAFSGVAQPALDAPVRKVDDSMRVERNTRLLLSNAELVTVHQNATNIQVLNKTSDDSSLCHYLAIGNDSVRAFMTKCNESAPGDYLDNESAFIINGISRQGKSRNKRDIYNSEDDLPDDTQNEIPQNSAPADGLSGLNALFRAMEAKKIKNGELKFTEKYLELAVFLGEPAFSLLHSKLHLSEDQIVNIVLGFVNQIQAIYYQPSLGGKLHITVVRIEIQKTTKFETYNGDRDLLLNSFCEYQQKLNPMNDSDWRHWDMALYLSAQNFFSSEGGKVNGVTMGLAPVGGVCYANNNCVIAEFGAVNDLGHPYPSAGLMSTWVAAHEMGHNLGIFHDGQPLNDCPANGYLMSSSRGTKGEVNWSSCSAKMFSVVDAPCLKDVPNFPMYDHRTFNLRPGQTWDANEQCQLFLKDEDASVYNTTLFSSFCENSIVCKSPTKIGYFNAGPALEGTFCGENSLCQHGQCLPAPEALESVQGQWSAWSRPSACASKCLDRSTGFRIEKRSCNNPKPKNTAQFCEGDSIRTRLCDDTRLCDGRPQLNVNLYAKQQCAEFARYVPDLSDEGLQIGHEPDRDWRACAIFCKMHNGPWYTPRYELNDLQEVANPFFPDGSWCHRDERLGNFYCQQHRCLPANARRGKQFLLPPSEELFMAPLNISDPNDIPKIRAYYTEYNV